MKTTEIHRTATSEIGEKTLQTGSDGAALREGILATFDGRWGASGFVDSLTP